MRRLSIVDVEGGHQPFSNEDGATSGRCRTASSTTTTTCAPSSSATATFRSGCDTEILPAPLRASRRRLPEQLRGKFAIAVWDGRRRRAVVARDRLGIKPLYYARGGDLVVFGSELKSLLASGLVAAELDYEAIDVYLTLGFFPGAADAARGRAKLDAGPRLVIEDGACGVERYWALPEAGAGEPVRTSAGRRSRRSCSTCSTSPCGCG